MRWDEWTFAKFTDLSDPRISRRGEIIAYTASKPNLKTNEYDRYVVVIDLKSGEERYIWNATKPRVSPSGRMAFLREKGEIWISSGDCGEKKLADFKRVVDFEWIDDRRILVTWSRRLDDGELFFDDSMPVWFDTLGFMDMEERILSVYDVESSEEMWRVELERLSQGIWHDGKILAAVPHVDSKVPQLWRYDLLEIGPEGKRVILQGTSLRPLQSVGGKVVLIGRKESKWLNEHRYVYLYDGVRFENVTEELVYNNLDARMDRRGRLFVTAAVEGSVELWMVLGREKEVVFGDHWVREFDVSENGTVVFIAQTEYDPGEVYVWREGMVERISSHNTAVAEVVPLRRAEHFRFRSLDLDIDGWYMRPDLEDGEKAPVVLFVHGGPKGMYGRRFLQTMQHLADLGFFVVYFNPRGNSGYDEDFALRVLKRVGLEDFQDIMNGLDEFLRIEPAADGERVGITGISYGGFMTNWAITQTKRFKAAVSENGISYWLTSHAFSDIGFWFDHELIGEDPDDENFKKLSPLFYVDRVETPILLIHSLEDYRCPLDQSLMFYNYLRGMGKEAYIAIFKKGSHGHSNTGSPRHRAKRHRLIAAFFKRKLVEGKSGFPIREILGGMDSEWKE